MTEDNEGMTPAQKEANRRANQLTVEAWKVWKETFLDLIERDFGPMKDDREKLVFEAGWKVGFHHAMRVTACADGMAGNN